MQIVQMNEQNYKQVAMIEAECFSQPWSEKTFYEELSNANAHTFVAVENGEAAGFLSVWEVCGEVKGAVGEKTLTEWSKSTNNISCTWYIPFLLPLHFKNNSPPIIA